MTDTLNWADVLAQLQSQMTQATFDTWVAQTKIVEQTEQKLIVAAPSAFAKDWLEHRLFDVIERTIARMAGPRQIEFVVVGPEGARPEEAGSEDEETDSEDSKRVGVELVSFDPALRGFVQTANYAIRFWQPYLARLASTPPFALWLTLKSFAYQGQKGDVWPSINTLAHICAGGNRHLILGRAARKGRGRVVGALEVLEAQKIVYVKRAGQGATLEYRFRVLENLPLLTPAQVGTLEPVLQAAHKRWIQQSAIDYEEWEQLSLPDVLGAL